jgi:hypothetical protein
MIGLGTGTGLDALRSVAAPGGAGVEPGAGGWHVDFTGGPIAIGGASHATVAALLASPHADFSRATAGLGLAADGSYAEFAAGAPRLGPRGLLIEPAATNRYPRSGDFAGVTAAGGLTITAGAAPVAGLPAFAVQDGGAGYLQFDSSGIAGLPAGTELVGSLLVRARTTGQLQFWIGVGTTGAGRVRWTVDLATAAVTLVSNPDGTDTRAGLEPLGNGAFRLWATTRIISADTAELLRLHNVAGILDIAHPQFETGPAPTSPIRTVAGPVTRAADALTLFPGAGRHDITVTFGDGTTRLLPGVETGGGWTVPADPERRHVARIAGTAASA